MATNYSPVIQDISQFIFGKRNGSRHHLRSLVIDQLYPEPQPHTYTNNVLNDIAGSLSRYVGNQRTVFDDGAPRSSSSSDANYMERQVERAFNQVLGRAIGRGADSFISALNGAFPAADSSEGPQVTFTSTRGMVSLYSANGNVQANGAMPATGLPGQISARQAVLYREASIIVADFQRVLSGLQAFHPSAVPEQVEGLRALVSSSAQQLSLEFQRVEEPRPERVRAYFDTLTLNLNEFGRRAFLNDPRLVATAEDEAQTAGFELLQNYKTALREAWDRFYRVDRSKRVFPSVSERVERANILLPALAQSNTDFMAAMDSVDFTEADRRSLAARFSKLKDALVDLGSINGIPLGKKRLRQPDITPYDITEWLERYSNYEGPNSLAVSGQYGLDFVVDQADTLFWVITPVVAHIKTTMLPASTGGTLLEQVLSNERVDWALNTILSQLDEIALLEVPGGVFDKLDE